jgi:transcriptional regulator with XRE-family HTH domain
MSQRQLARRAGVHHSTVSRLLRGAVPTLATALALQDALDPTSAAESDTDVRQLHPAVLAGMLRRDGILTDDEIDRLVSVYIQLMAARTRRPASTPRVAARPRRMR